MEFRRVTPQDIEAVTTLAIRGLRPHLYPCHLSREKVTAMVSHFAHGGHGWNMVAFDGAKPVALAAVLVQEMPWFERCEAVVVALYSERAGAGRRIVREMFRWYVGQPMLRALRWPLEFDAQPSMMKVAERMGFNSFNVTASHYKT